MKLKTRLLITFLTIILLPVILSGIAFAGIGLTLIRSQSDNLDMKIADYFMFSDSAQTYSKATEEIFTKLQQQADTDAGVFESQEFLNEIGKSLEGKSSYLLVRKNGDIFFTNNSKAADRIFDILPEFGDETENSGMGYFYDDLQKLVKQIDFKFSDGSQGSVFVITKINSIISRSFLMDMFIAIVLILVFTSIMLTRWIHKGVFKPIGELNLAMQQIADGNFDYVLTAKCDGELEENYKNYEEMRLRLKESAEEKIQNDRKNRELISNISHDLKTPITAIKGYVEGIMDGVADTPEKMEKYIKTIYNKANDMDRLINELTIYSGIDSNRIPYNFHKINVADYFGDCIEDVGLDLESKNIELNYSNLVTADTMIIADPEQLKRVINNIVGNSVKYMDKKKGMIDIRILDEIDSIRVEIEDNGKGISAKDLPNIFERFFRTDASRNSSKGGSGIGLSIVKKIVEDHGGYIWATSKENEGTCLHFVIRKYREAETNE
ncbi:MAG: HAMP domain-containing sensor histidine kinase [Lachnospiraceae bacterium]|nr:HAMP domain-containing sensor histidine kinase [Lachnospiraceae bacterium]MDD3659411.1 HAMP domain-containing sensor histidine kinase [Lachnospiraceae bacterium]